MQFSPHLWLLLCYAQFARNDIIEDYDLISNKMVDKDDRTSVLPVKLGADQKSGCICRASQSYHIIVCFGNYYCRKFPEVKFKSKILRVRTTAISKILTGELDSLNHLNVLDIEANHQLKYLQPGIFRNLSKLEQLSISFNTGLQTIDKNLFEGLKNLRNLTLVNNGFIDILQLIPAFKPSIIPLLKGLDLSENSFERIPEKTFLPMKGSPLKRLDIHLCRLDFIHKRAFLPLSKLQELHIGENDLDSTLIGNFLKEMMKEGINLAYLGLSGMGFRKFPPRGLLDIIANSTIKGLVLARNQFEVINNDTFPRMPNIEMIDLRKVLAIAIESYSFISAKFPNLKMLLLSGNNLPGIHHRYLSNQLLLLDLCCNKGYPNLYYDIDKDAFAQSRELRVLNLSYNVIRALFDYSFRGLDNLRILSLENGTIYHIGVGTFKSTKNLEVLNLANNPLVHNANLTSAQFDGLNELKMLTLSNCGIRYFNDDNNIFEMTPNLTHLILRSNQMYYITAETLKPLKLLKVLDLSGNLLIAWWKPLFLSSGVTPQKIYLTNNKISQFSPSMIQDINYLLENDNSTTMEIDFMDNVFICDCNAMYATYLWLQVNDTALLKNYFAHSNFLCRSPNLWEDKRVIEYLSSIKRINCLMYEKISNAMLLVWTAPSLIIVIALAICITVFVKYRIYIRYWLFLAKIALGRKLIGKSVNADINRETGYKYDAFVSYSNEDADFVTEMISQLEASPPYFKLCVYERDFEIGAFISEAVLNSINDSKFVILVVSNNFAKSQWCRWETQLAEYHRLFLNDGTAYDPLVLLKIGEVENKYMTTTLKYLLKTKIYLSWNESNTDMFWKKLRRVLNRIK